MPLMRRQSQRQLMERQRLRSANQRVNQRIVENFHATTSAFENEMRNIVSRICHSCRVKFFTLQPNDTLCKACIRKPDRAQLFSQENNMDFGLIPPELQGLSMVEEVLIARVHPVISVFKIHGQQRSYSGHVMNFNQHSETVARRLPNNPRSLSSILILKRDTPSGVIEFRVRATKIRNALVWLKRNNLYYRDIIIDETVLEELPEDGNILNLMPTLQSTRENESSDEHDNLLSHSCFPNIPQLDTTRAILSNLRDIQDEVDIGDWPELSQNPLNEFNTEGIISRAFPCLFPYGRGDLRAPRIRKLTPHQYFKYLMDYYDGRFANHSRFPYYAFNSMARWDALNCGNVYVRLNRFEGMTAEDIVNRLGNPAYDLATSIMYYGANFRGTRSYWKQRCTELIQMVRQIGTPAIFFTLSAADYHWPDLFRLLADTDNPDSIDERRRRTLMHDNPATVAWFFEKRCDVFMKQFMRIFFNVKDYWYRFEWQHRGSPHIHGLLWLDDAPVCSDIDSVSEQDRQTIVKYFDELVSACITSVIPVPITSNPCRQRLMDLREDEKATDLDKILTAVQRHTKCGSHCMRKKRGQGRQLSCRFKFPMQLEDVSSLRREESGAWVFVPKRNDALLQRYNQYITQVWRGNTDFTPITSNEAVINYISKYASKGEYSSGAFSDILKAIVTRAEPSTPAVTIVRQLLVSSVGERNYSAQEVHHLLMGWSLFHCSRSMIVLSLKEEWQRYGVRTNSTFLAHYARRDRELDDISLFDFAKNYRYSGTRMIKRRQECIVRVLPFIKEPEGSEPNHEYFILQCKLNIPWRGVFEDIKPSNITWRDLYVEHVNQIERADEFAREFPQEVDEFEPDEFPDEAAHIVRNPGMAAARIQPGIQRIDQVGMRPIDDAFEWHDFQAAGLTNTQIDSYLRTFRTIEPRPVDRQPTIDFRSMSAEQQRVIGIVRSQLDDTTEIKRVIVQGKAGTGKSAVIRFICEHLERTLGADSYQVLAPTGAAALNVEGKTIHSYLRIPANSQLAPLNGINLRSFQVQFEQVRYIIIDEYSMIGLRMLHKIHNRLCEAKGSYDECFGGYNLILFGDLRQLPPVKDTAIYMDANDDFSEFSKELLESFQARIVLSTCFRQGETENRFRSMLDNIARGIPTEEDWNLLNSRRSILHNLDNFSNAVRLFSTNAQVSAYNDQILSANRQPVAIINAWHNNTIARQGSDDQAHGLTRTLKLSLGSRVMLRKNISVKHGLVNGSIGTIVDIVYNTGDRPPSLPFALLIDFDKFKGPYIRNKAFPILPVASCWKDQSTDCTRKQFPINLANAITIHKSQGLTLDKAIVDIGERELAAGCTYVALSRVRKLDDLILANYCDQSRLTSIGEMQHVRRREQYLSGF